MSYDLRNLIGCQLVAAFLPLFALAQAFAPTWVFPIERRWRVPDGAFACCLALLCVGLSFTLAKGDEELKRRFAAEQLVKGAGLKVNQKIERLLISGCTIINADDYLYTISAFQPFRDKMPYYHFEAPITGALKLMLDNTSGCTGMLYPSDRSHPSILSYVSAKPDFAKAVEDRGWTLRVSNRGGG